MKAIRTSCRGVCPSLSRTSIDPWWVGAGLHGRLSEAKTWSTHKTVRDLRTQTQIPMKLTTVWVSVRGRAEFARTAVLRRSRENLTFKKIVVRPWCQKNRSVSGWFFSFSLVLCSKWSTKVSKYNNTPPLKYTQSAGTNARMAKLSQSTLPPAWTWNIRSRLLLLL